jgi:hypothetical protein
VSPTIRDSFRLLDPIAERFDRSDRDRWDARSEPGHALREHEEQSAVDHDQRFFEELWQLPPGRGAQAREQALNRFDNAEPQRSIDGGALPLLPR